MGCWGGGLPHESARVRDATCARVLLTETPGPRHSCLDQTAPRAVLGVWTGAQGFLSPVKTDCHTPHIAPTVSLVESTYAKMWPAHCPSQQRSREKRPGISWEGGAKAGGQRCPQSLGPGCREQGSLEVACPFRLHQCPNNTHRPTPHSRLMKMTQIQQACSWLFTQKSWKLLSTQNPHMDVCSRLILN